MRNSLKQLIGLISFFVAIGMLLMLLLSSKVGAVILIAILLIIGFWCLSDFFQDRDTLLLIVQDSGTLGIQLAICLQFCGTRFFYFVTGAATERL